MTQAMGIALDGEMAMDAAAKWAKIQDALAGDDARKELVRMALSAFANAQEAYNASYNGGPERDGVMRAGTFAWLYLENFEHVRVTLMGGATPKDAVDKLQAVAGWLVRMGWHGLPRAAYVGMREIPLGRTAAGVHTDMLRYRESAERLQAAAASARAA